MKLFLATSNQGKVLELREILKSSFTIFKDIEGRAAKDAEEVGHTFLDNARIKAIALEQELLDEGFTDFAVLADDSGLCVEALGGAPGVHSARYAGDHVPPDSHMNKLLRELEVRNVMKLEEREAFYHCALVLRINQEGANQEWIGEGQCHGRIGFEPKGQSGFGYDPIFLFPNQLLSFSEVTYEEKNKHSHRTKAFEALGKAFQGSRKT